MCLLFFALVHMSWVNFFPEIYDLFISLFLEFGWFWNTQKPETLCVNVLKKNTYMLKYYQTEYCRYYIDIWL